MYVRATQLVLSSTLLYSTQNLRIFNIENRKNCLAKLDKKVVKIASRGGLPSNSRTNIRLTIILDLELSSVDNESASRLL